MGVHVPIPTWDDDEENPSVLWVDADELSIWERSEAARLINAVDRVLSNDDFWALSEWSGQRIGGYLVIDDPYVIQDLEEAGEFEFDEFYWDPDG